MGREVRLKIEDLAVIEALARPVTEALMVEDRVDRVAEALEALEVLEVLEVLMVEDRVDRMAVAAPVGRPIPCGSSSMRWSSTRMGTAC